MFQSSFTLALLSQEAHQARLEEAARQRLVNQAQFNSDNRFASFVKRSLAVFTSRVSQARKVEKASVALQARTQK